MSAIAFSFQDIPPAFSFAASPVASLQHQWPHTFSQLGLPLGTSGEPYCRGHVCVAQLKVFKGCSRGQSHSKQLRTVPFLCLQPEAKSFLSRLMEEENQSRILMLPASQEEPCTYTGKLRWTPWCAKTYIYFNNSEF